MEQRVSKLKTMLTSTFVILLLASTVFLFNGYKAGHFNSVQTLQAYIRTFGLFAPIVLTVIQALQVILPVLPGFFGCIVGAGIFGASGGFWCNYIGISAGSIIAFLLARRFGVTLVRKVIPLEKYNRFVHWVNQKKSYTLVLFLSILLPLAPDDFLCYFSGLTGMSARKFIWIILAAKPWCILAYSLFFAYLT